MVEQFDLQTLCAFSKRRIVGNMSFEPKRSRNIFLTVSHCLNTVRVIGVIFMIDLAIGHLILLQRTPQSSKHQYSGSGELLSAETQNL